MYQQAVAIKNSTLDKYISTSGQTAQQCSRNAEVATLQARLLCPVHSTTVSYTGLSVITERMNILNPLKGRGVNWLHFAIQV